MSRIHEALKKAERERAANQPTDAAVPPLALGPDTPVRGNGVPSVAVDSAAQNSAIVPPPSEYLRFDDLRLRCTKTRWHLDPKMNVFFGSDLRGEGTEQFRTLRSRLYRLNGKGKPLRTLLVTSPLAAEGKTFVANNLAQAIVRQPDRRALLIDGDLRCPRLHVPLGASTAPGLSDYLRGEADELGIIQCGQEGSLCFIACGNEASDPSELLSNGRLKKLLGRITPVFDWVILDSPPCLGVSDASILADLCDGVLMVVGAGSTPTGMAQKACREFRERNLIGVVLNRAQELVGYGGESYYYSYAQTDAEKLNN